MPCSMRPVFILIDLDKKRRTFVTQPRSEAKASLRHARSNAPLPLDQQAQAIQVLSMAQGVVLKAKLNKPLKFPSQT